MARVLPVVAIFLAACLPAGASSPSTGFLPPRAESGDEHVTADPLPTVQINGVVWDQEIVGDTVYAVGDFTSARPAGAPPGVNETPRSNILAYNLHTGQLIQSFAPTLNRQAKAVTASPDGSRIYVGGQFTSVDGVNRWRLAALDATTGNLITNWSAAVDFTVNDLVATDTTLYAGGAFNMSSGNPRSRLAAFSATNGALLSWAPSANDDVHAMVLSPDGSRLFVGGRFTTINGASAYGMGAIDPENGALIPWPANEVVRVASTNGAILALDTDGDAIYGGGFTWGRSTGNLEGTFSADPDTGDINWIQDCHGDTYSVATTNGYSYLASHDHFCGNVNGFPQTDPWSINMRHALSFTTEPTGVMRREPWGYHNWEGFPAPSPVHWYPRWQIGEHTGQDQAVWSLTANDQYLVAGGEFLRVNNVPQQGLVRFAVKPTAPADEGPELAGAQFPINARSTAPGEARISFPANTDKDDHELNYRITRNGQDVHTARVASTFWDRPIVGFTDTGLTPGETYGYRVWVTDDDGNTAASDTTQVTIATSGEPSPYADEVMGDDALVHWRLNESPGAGTARDELGFDDGTVGSNVSFGAAGALQGEGSTAATFTTSSTSRVISGNQIPAPDTVSAEAWVRTSSTGGGRIVGFGNSGTGTSGSNTADRTLYMTNNGRIMFGVHTRVEGPGPNASLQRRVVESQPGLNDNQWHHVVGTLGPDGMHLYVDGVRVGSRGDTNSGRGYNGFWRVGHDTLASWPSRPSSDGFSGQIDEVAIYRDVLKPNQVASHYAASGRTPAVQPAPADAYGAAVYDLDPYLYYRLDETSGTVANDRGIRGNTGDYVGTSTRGQEGVIDGNAAVRFTGSGFVASRSPIYSPGSYSLETWFNTETETGGKLIGFGSSRTGNSGTSDRHVYMRDDGRLVFGVREGDANQVVTDASYNDGDWHHVVATQGDDGMKLYVDGALVGTNPQRVASSYTGYWRIGGDTTPSDATSNGFAGVLDEAAVYDRVLTAEEVTNHLELAGGEVANVPPTASFTVDVDLLTIEVDGSGSTDPDGEIVSYEWDFGDGNTASGVTASHTYDAADTYTLTLTVTDDDDATDVKTEDVTVTEAEIVALDEFERQVAGGFGQADVGGAWTLGGSASNFAVSDGQGRVTLPTAPAGRTARLGSVALEDADVRVDFTFDKAPIDGDIMVSALARASASSDYRLRFRVTANGANLQLFRLESWSGAVIGSVSLPGFQYTPGSVIHLRFQVTGTGTTELAGKVWFDDEAEPTDWQVATTDTAGVLQQAGGIGVHAQLTGSGANAPVVASVDDLVAQVAQP